MGDMVDCAHAREEIRQEEDKTEEVWPKKGNPQETINRSQALNPANKSARTVCADPSRCWERARPTGDKA
jgi:hypothetical protein